MPGGWLKDPGGQQCCMEHPKGWPGRPGTGGLILQPQWFNSMTSPNCQSFLSKKKLHHCWRGDSFRPIMDGSIALVQTLSLYDLSMVQRCQKGETASFYCFVQFSCLLLLHICHRHFCSLQLLSHGTYTHQQHGRFTAGIHGYGHCLFSSHADIF